MATEDAKFFTVIDAMKGYHKCPLDEKSRALRQPLKFKPQMVFQVDTV